MEVWDIRENNKSKASISTPTSDQGESGHPVMDIESIPKTESLLVTCGRKVMLKNGKTLETLWQVKMPEPLSFLEEGGASLHPNGSKFIAVSLSSFNNDVISHHAARRADRIYG